MKLINLNQNSEQGKRSDQREFSSVVMFFCFLGILFIVIWTSLSFWWAIFATWMVCVILAFMFLYGACIANQRYDEEMEKYIENKGIDNGIVEGESAINNEGVLIYF